MKWREIEEKYGYPIAFTYPTWKEGDYYVIKSKTDVVAYRNHTEVTDIGDNLVMIMSLYHYWYENDKWEPLFGFY